MRVLPLVAILALAGCSGGRAPQTLVDGDSGASLEECIAQPAPPPAPYVRPAVGTRTMTVQNIMPPGQSGHFPNAQSCPTQAGSCAVPGQAPDTYGPHIDDQRLMYWRSEFKPGNFMDISQAEPDVTLTLVDPADTVRIYRDPYGVPVVHADTAYGVWYGAGYALAQDRLFLLDQAIRQARGTSGEVLGAGSVPADVQARVLTYTEAEYQELEAGLSDLARQALSGHVAGINAWIAEVNALGPVSPDLPQEMVALNYQPSPVTTTDVLALGVLMTRFVAAAGGDEMENVKALRALEDMHGKETGRAIFRDVLWVDDAMADVTVTDRRYTNISTPVALRDQAFSAAADFADTLPLDLAEGNGTGGYADPSLAKLKLPEGFEWPVDPTLLAKAVQRWQDLPDHISASYMTVISPDITADGSTVLINGPQLGYSYPTLLAEVEVHGGGFDARGSTVAGLPVVGIGYGERIAWGLTTGESKTIDSFIVELNPDNPNQYRFNGEFVDMDCRTEVVDYRSAASGVPNVSEPEPGLNSDTIEVCRTHHGPVVARSADGLHARAVQYAMWKREVDTIEGVLAWNRVDTFPEFYQAMAKVTWNENTMYADADGNIAYFHPGLHPWRHPSADQRLPLDGSGRQEHCGTLSFENTPKSVNPARGYLHNWNNKPAAGWGDGTGGDASQEPSGHDARNVNWETVIRAQLDGDGLTTADLVEMDKRIGRIDPRAAALLTPILACDGRCDLAPEEQALVDALKGWDRQHYNDAIDIEDETATDTPGATIFAAIVDVMISELVTDVLPAEFIQRHSVRGNHPYDAGTFHKLLAKLLDPSKSSIAPLYDWLKGRSRDEFVHAALTRALATLQSDYSSTDPAAFTRVHARSSVCSLADPLAGPCLTMPHQDRGSWLHIIHFDE